MTDQAITRMLQGTCEALERIHAYEPCNYLLPSYNALLQAARANHPEDDFLRILSSGDSAQTEEISSGVLLILCTQLRIALESLQPEGDAPTRNLNDREGWTTSGSGPSPKVE